MTTISQSVRNFETWLAGELGSDLVADDLREKHEKMRSGGAIPIWRISAPGVMARAGSSGASMISTMRR